MALIPLNPPAPDTFARPISWDASTVLKYWHLTSLDAPTVAVTWAAALAWAAHAQAPLWQLTVLFLLVWTFYVLDRVLDARRNRYPLQDRHYFHWRHRRVLVPLAVTAAGVSAWLIASRFPAASLARDSAVGLATLAYFSGVHWHRRFTPWLARPAAQIGSREAVVGILFSAGCLLPAAATAPAHSLAEVAVPALALAAVAWLNVRAIGRWEEPGTTPKDTRVRLFSLAVAIAAGASGLIIAFLQPRSALLLFSAGASALLIAQLDRHRDSLSRVALRAAADLVLLTPAAILAVAWVAR